LIVNYSPLGLKIVARSYMENITDINEYKDKRRLTTKGGAKHLRIVITKNERVVLNSSLLEKKHYFLEHVKLMKSLILKLEE
jgi:hypothetical protein